MLRRLITSSGTRTLVWTTVGAILAAILTILACFGFFWLSLSLLGITALIIFVLCHPEMRVVLPAAVGCLSIIFASSVFLPDDSSFVSIGARIVGSALLILSAHQSKLGRYGSTPVNKRTIRRWAISLAAPIAIYIALATLPFGMWNNFIAYEVGVVLLVFVIYYSGPQLSSGTLRKAVIAALTTTVIVSLLAGVALPGLGIEQGRLRGILNNANLLGFYAFLLGAVALTLVKRKAARYLLLAAVAAALLWSSSRASTLSLVILIVVLVVLTRFAAGMAFIAGLAVVTVAAATIWPSLLDVLEGVTRQNNSRSGSWDVALAVLEKQPWSGVGLGNEASIIASSPLRAAADAGIPGLIVIFVLWIAIIYASRRAGRRTLALGLAACVHSCFEGWLLSPVGPIILVFALAWLIVAYSEIKSRTSFTKSLAKTFGYEGEYLGGRL